MLSHLVDFLQQRLQQPLPGVAAHLLMSHREREEYFKQYSIPEHARLGSVMLLLYEKQGRIHLPLMVRTEDGRVHSGQVSLPGGKVDAIDESYGATALRETEEEIGIPRSDIRMIGGLTPIYIPPSNFLVHPFIGWVDTPPQFTPNRDEVAHLLEAEIEGIFDPGHYVSKTLVLRNGKQVETPAFIYREQRIWGATAMILSEFRLLWEESQNQKP